MRKALYWVLIGIFVAIFAISAYIVVEYFVEAGETKEYWGNVSDDFDNTEPSTTQRPNGTTQLPGTNGTTLPVAPPTTLPTIPTDPIVPPTTLPDATDPSHVHEYFEHVVAPTCTVGGYTAYICNCGVFYRENETEATGHVFGDWQYGIYASNDYNRPRTRTCLYCPETQSQNILSRYKSLLKQNKDVVGYIRIVDDEDATSKWYKYLVDYPILHHPSEKDYYLKRNLNGKYDERGAIYLRESCDMLAPTDVLTIYGHAMADGQMFGRLNRYLNKTFFKEHPYVQVFDLYEEYTYEVVCIFKTSGTYGVGFPYHLYDDFKDEAEYLEFINGVRNIKATGYEGNTIFNSDVETEYGDTFILLSTCEYTIDNGRLVLVAKRVN